MAGMVGIVLVSHSPRLAAGLMDLLAQLGTEAVPILVAAGTTDGRLGTSADLVAAAVAQADDGSGVVVIPDLGSAVLSVKMATEDTDPNRVVMVDAPFVEGAVAAAVTAASGADLATVVKSAQDAREIPKF
jgi:phosphoenolpyruvate---glycerone phosphotransferase subunit DhaM